MDVLTGLYGHEVTSPLVSQKDYQCTEQYVVPDRRLLMMYIEKHPIYAGKRIDVYACNVDHNAVIQQGKLVETAHMHRFHMTQLMTGDPGQPGWDDASKHVKNKFVQ